MIGTRGLDLAIAPHAHSSVDLTNSETTTLTNRDPQLSPSALLFRIRDIGLQFDKHSISRPAMNADAG